VTAADLGADGAMAALLADALLPNLVQTSEGGPALVHGGPFANIAQGCNSVLATGMALGVAEDVVTEAGFGFDLGGEKFLDIKCPVLGAWPSGVVLVVTIASLAAHGGGALDAGLCQLEHHVGAIRRYGLPVVICVNRFPGDSPRDLAAVQRFAAGLGVAAVPCDAVAHGSDGALELADAVDGFGPAPAPWHPYTPDAPLLDKLSAVARTLYGADGVDLAPAARAQLARIDLPDLPVCIAKTPLSLTDDPKVRGVPRGFRITVRELRLMAGAGFVVAVAGDVETMPGLPRDPAARHIGVRDGGVVYGV
jgi:formate--tetrahydrofolate ligase